MVFRWIGEALLGSGLSIVGMRSALKVEKRFAGGKAFTVRSMMSRQMLMAAMHRGMKRAKKAHETGCPKHRRHPRSSETGGVQS